MTAVRLHHLLGSCWSIACTIASEACACCWTSAARARRPRGIRGRGHHGAGSGPGAGADESRPAVRCVLRDEAGRPGDGARDEPLDRGEPRRPAAGDGQHPARRGLSVHVADRTGGMTAAEAMVFVVDDDVGTASHSRTSFGRLGCESKRFASRRGFPAQHTSGRDRLLGARCAAPRSAWHGSAKADR